MKLRMKVVGGYSEEAKAWLWMLCGPPNMNCDRDNAVAQALEVKDGDIVIMGKEEPEPSEAK